jgi:hypothetical protein
VVDRGGSGGLALRTNAEVYEYMMGAGLRIVI